MNTDWPSWRKERRKQLIAARETIPSEVHQQWSQNITDFLKQEFPQLQKMVVGIYWPFRGEYDPRSIAQYLLNEGATLALPEVIRRNEALCFREWTPDMAMKTGSYGIAVPIDSRQMLPNALLIPMVGFDACGYRLGYGSGYFDRTLATYDPQPLTIGIAFELQRLENTFPQPHDIPMQYVVTEAGAFCCNDNLINRGD